MSCLQHALGERRIFLCSFSTSLVLFEYDRAVIPCRSSTSSWALLNAISPLCGMENQTTGCPSAQAFVTVKGSKGHCHAPEGAGEVSSLTPMGPLGNPSWGSSLPALFPAPGSLSPGPGREGGIQCGQDGDRSLL